MNVVNLIPARRRQAKDRKMHTIKLASGLAVYGAVLVVAYFLCDHYAVSDTRAIDTQSRHVAVGLNASAHTITNVTQEIAHVQQKLLTAQAVGKQPDWSALMVVLAQNLDDNAVLDLCRFQRVAPASKTPGEKGAAEPAEADAGQGGQLLLVLGGVAKTQSDVSDYALRLEQTGLFDQVKLVRTNRQSNGKAVAFQVECILQEGEKTQ